MRINPTHHSRSLKFIWSRFCFLSCFYIFRYNIDLKCKSIFLLYSKKPRNIKHEMLLINIKKHVNS